MASVIVSVEKVTLTLSSGTNPAQANLTKGQNFAACTPFYSMREAAAAIGGFSNLMPEVWFDDNAGTARVNAQLFSGDDVQVEIFVVEWDLTKVNVQQVTFTIATSATTGTAAITAVNQAKAFIVHNDRISSSGPYAYDRTFTSAAFTSDTQVTVTRGFASTAIGITGRIFVVECIGTEFSVQHATPSLTASGTTGDATISSVDTAKTFLVGSYTQSGAVTDVRRVAVWFELTTATNVQLQRLGGGAPSSNAITGSIFVVTCAADEWSVQRAQPTILAAETSDDTTISAVDLALAVVNSCARMNFTMPHADESGNGFTYFVGMTLAATTTVRAARRVAVAQDGYYSFEVVEFANPAPDIVISVPLHDFTLASFVPSVGISVNANVPLHNFALSLPLPLVGISVNAIVPSKDFTLTLPVPLVGISVNIKPPIKDFTLALQAPTVKIIGSVSVPIQFFTSDNIEFFAGGVIDFFDTTGLFIHAPLRNFILEFYPPLVGISTNIVVPDKNFSLSFNVPTVNIAIDIKVLNVKKFGLEFFNPIIHSVSKPKKFPVEIDLTPPVDDTRENRYLHKNFDLIKDIVKEGATGQFTTVDGKTVHVRHGIIIDIFE